MTAQNGNEGVSRAGEGNTGNSGVRHSFNVNVSVLKGGAATNEVAEWSTALKGLSDVDSEETILERMQNIVRLLDARPNLRRWTNDGVDHSGQAETSGA